MPEISIIVPVYNVEKYLNRCIESIIAQTFLDFELILINDGSTDNSGKICDIYLHIDNRIRVIHQLNSGVSAARNRGIREAKGKYIMFCDSDDWVHKKWCENLYLKIGGGRVFATCDFQKVKEDGTFLDSSEHRSNEIATCKTYFELWKRGLSSYVVNKIYCRDVLLQNGIFFAEHISFAEDVNFNVRYYQMCDDIVVVPEKLYYYQDNSDSLMHRKYDDFFKIYALPFSVRLPLIEAKYYGEYCDFWLADFIQMLSYVHLRSDLNIISKLRYNQKILNSNEFQFCLKYTTGSNESPLTLKLLRTNNYYLYWLFEQMYKLKTKIFK